MNTFNALLEVKRSRDRIPMIWFVPPLCLALTVGPLAIFWLTSMTASKDVKAAIFVVGVLVTLGFIFTAMFLCLFKIDVPFEKRENALREAWAKELGLGRASSLPKNLDGKDAVYEFVDAKDGELHAYRLTVKNGVATVEDGKGNIIAPKDSTDFEGVATDDPNSALWERSTGKEDDRS